MAQKLSEIYITYNTLITSSVRFTKCMTYSKYRDSTTVKTFYFADLERFHEIISIVNIYHCIFYVCGKDRARTTSQLMSCPTEQRSKIIFSKAWVPFVE